MSCVCWPSTACTSISRWLVPRVPMCAPWPRIGPRLTVDDTLAHRLSRGQTLLMEAGPAGLTAVFDQRQRLLGIAESDGGGHLVPRRWMNQLENRVNGANSG